MVVDFKFIIGQKVQTPFGDIGIIEMLGLDTDGRRYYVLRSQEDKWFFENQLMSLEDAQKLAQREV